MTDKIDWTQPVETDEEPPRPVRVLCVDGHDPNYPVIFITSGTLLAASLEGRDVIWPDGSPRPHYRLRNVAPPENRWGFKEMKADRDKWKAEAECLAAEWDRQIDLRNCVVDELRSEVGQLKRDNAALVKDIASLGTERDRLSKIVNDDTLFNRMRPVVDAAVAWAEAHPAANAMRLWQRVLDAVRAYQQGQPEAVEKSCGTCKTCTHQVNSHCFVGDCISYNKWEPKQ